MTDDGRVDEKGTLDEFFQDQIAGGFTCPNIQALFDAPGSMDGATRLNKIFAQLASFENPDFLGMDAGLNGLKGSVCWDNIFYQSLSFSLSSVSVLCFSPL